MNIKIQQFLGKNHSWSVVGWGLARAAKKMGYNLDLYSTDGIQNLPSDLKENIIGYNEENSQEVIGSRPTKNYDSQISYTCMKNWGAFLANGSKNRIGIWSYEFDGKNTLPNGFAKYYRDVDAIAAPSNFAKRVFVNSGVPENIIKVVSHGVEEEFFTQNTTLDLPTKKNFKILSNIAQNHLRKNIPGLLDAYGKAFTNKDDVCLILKAKEKPIQQPFDVSLKDCLNDFYRKYPNHAELILLDKFLPDISALYRSVDAVFTMSRAECFYMPGLEALVSNRLNIAPNYSGQLDFLNDKNALLVSGTTVRCDPRAMYWEGKSNAIWFQPSIDDAVEKLRYAYENHERLNAAIKNDDFDKSKYSWDCIWSQM